MKSFLIIGMGRFGQHLARRLMERGNDVMIVDIDEKVIAELAPRFTDAQIGDCTNADVLRSLGVGNFDACFVAIGENFQSSLEITSLLKELGAKMVVSKANKEIQAKFLLRNGADTIVYPERDIAEKLAIQFSANNVLDYVALTPELAMFEIRVPESWIGKTIGVLNIRRRFNVNVLTVQRGTGLTMNIGADFEFQAGDCVNVVGKEADVARITAKI